MASWFRKSTLKQKFSLAILGCTSLTTLTLGTWQWKRMQWKKNIIEERRYSVKDATPSFSIDEALNKSYFNSIQVEGRFLHSMEQLVGKRQNPLFKRNQVRGSQYGYYIITPFECTDGNIIMVNRGWVALTNMDKIPREKASISLTGVVRKNEDATYIAKENFQLDKNIWCVLNATEMYKTLRSSFENETNVFKSSGGNAAQDSTLERKYQNVFVNQIAGILREITSKKGQIHPTYPLFVDGHCESKKEADGTIHYQNTETDEEKKLFVRPDVSDYTTFYVTPAKHLGYAITWYSLSIYLLYLMYRFGRIRPQRFMKAGFQKKRLDRTKNLFRK